MPSPPKEKASPRRRNPIFQFSFFGKPSPQRIKEHFENLEQQSELLKELSDKSCQATLNAGEDDEMTLTGYRRSPFRTACTWLCFILTVGLLRLFMHWWKHWLLLATHTPCAIDIAERLLITEQYEGKHTVYYVKDVITLNSETFKEMRKKPEKWSDFVPVGEASEEVQLAVHFSGGVFKMMESIRIFKCKQLRYVWDDHTASFVKLRGLDTDVPSIVASYAVYNIETGLVVDIANKSKINLCVWSPNSNDVLFVQQNDVYFLRNLETEIRLTTDGVDGIVYNGVPDWVYEEEVFGSGGAMWLSPDGSKLAIASFNDTEVKDFDYNLYNDQYETVVYFKNIQIMFTL